MTRYKLKITTYDNEPVIKAQAEDIGDFIKDIKEKLSGRKSGKL